MAMSALLSVITRYLIIVVHAVILIEYLNLNALKPLQIQMQRVLWSAQKGLNITIAFLWFFDSWSQT